MEIKTEIKISVEELVNLIKESLNVDDGTIDFIIKERSRMCGDILVTKSYFDGVIITNTKQK